MPTCENCMQKWSWKQTFKKTFTLFPEMTCPYCGETQYQTQKSKTRGVLLTPVILLPLFIQMFFNVQGVFLLSSFPILAIIVIFLYPFLVELSNKEEYIDIFKK